jgi:hypothetical protein
MRRPGADLIAHYLSPDRLPVRDRWSRRHADTQRRLCERFAAPVIAAVTCQDIKTEHTQKIVNAAPTAGEGNPVACGRPANRTSSRIFQRWGLALTNSSAALEEAPPRIPNWIVCAGSAASEAQLIRRAYSAIRRREASHHQSRCGVVGRRAGWMCRIRIWQSTISVSSSSGALSAASVDTPAGGPVRPVPAARRD